MSPNSPCVRICRLNTEQVCVGCGRNLTEIAQWSQMTPADKQLCIQSATARLNAVSSNPSSLKNHEIKR